MRENARRICWVFSIILLFSALILSSISLCILFFGHTIIGIFDLLGIITWMAALVIIPVKHKTKIAAAFISLGITGLSLSFLSMVNAIRFQAGLYGISPLSGVLCWVAQFCFFILLILLGVLLGGVIKPDVWKKQYVICLIAIVSGICIIWLATYLHANLFIKVNPIFIIILFIFGILDILFGYWIGPRSIKEPDKLLLIMLIIMTTIIVWASMIYIWQRGVMT